MADNNEQQERKLIDYNLLVKYDELIKNWFNVQLVYAEQSDIDALFDEPNNQ